MTASSTPPYHLIDNPTSLTTALPLLHRTRQVALDIEADSFHHYYEKTCLIQLTADGDNFIIDPLAGLDVQELLALLADRSLILHDAGYDLRMLNASFGFRPKRPVFDTMLAARLLGIERFSLTALIEQFFEVSLPKKGQKSDWSRRPLSGAQLAYAAQDTHYLEPLADALARQLERIGRTEWHRQWCEQLVRNTGLPPREKDPQRWRIKGANHLSPRQLAYLHAIWHWRETEACKADLPPFKILGNDALRALAIWACDHPAAPLDQGPKLPRHFNAQRRNRLVSVLRKAHALPPDQWPSPRRLAPKPPDVADVRKRTDRLLARCRRIAHALQIAPDVLVSRATVETIARARPTTLRELIHVAHLMPWQADLLKDVLLNP